MSYKQKPRVRYRSPRQVQASRSQHARKIDAGLRAPIAKTDEQWMNQPNRFDLPNVDTPKKSIQEEKETTRTFEPKPLTRSQIRQRLAMHKYYGVTH